MKLSEDFPLIKEVMGKVWSGNKCGFQVSNIINLCICFCHERKFTCDRIKKAPHCSHGIKWNIKCSY